MSPLSVEVLNESGDWTLLRELKPGNPPGSLSDMKEDGSRTVIVFQCQQDDRSSVIYEATEGADLSNSAERLIAYSEARDVALLRNGESHTLTVRANSSAEKTLRFTHRDT